MRNHIRVLPLLTGLVLMHPACGGKTERTCDPQCNEDACEECVDGECVVRCKEGLVCDGAGNCVDPAVDCEPPCNEDGCEECVDGECVFRCEEGQVCDGAGTCIEAGKLELLWDDMLDSLSFDAFKSSTLSTHGNTNHALGENQYTWVGPSLRPVVGVPSGVYSGNGHHMNLARPSGSEGFDEGPTIRGASVKFLLDNDDPESHYDWNDQCDAAGGNQTRRRTELRNLGYAMPYDEATQPGGLFLYPGREERWHVLSIYVDDDWDTGVWDNNRIHLFQFKPLSDGMPWLTIDIRNFQWGVRSAWSAVENALWSDCPWYQVGEYDPDSLSYSSRVELLDDLPDVEVSLAALEDVRRGGWTHWAMNFRVDNRGSAEGGMGFFRLYKRYDEDPEWTHVIEQVSRPLTVGGNSIDRGIGVESASPANGSYARFGFYDSVDARSSQHARPERKFYLGRAVTAGPNTDLAGIWAAINEGRE